MGIRLQLYEVKIEMNRFEDYPETERDFPKDWKK